MVTAVFRCEIHEHMRLVMSVRERFVIHCRFVNAGIRGRRGNHSEAY